MVSYGSRCVTLMHDAEETDVKKRMTEGDGFEFFRNCFISLLALGFERIDTPDGDGIIVDGWGIGADELVEFLVLEKTIQETSLSHAH